MLPPLDYYAYKNSTGGLQCYLHSMFMNMSTVLERYDANFTGCS